MTLGFLRTPPPKDLYEQDYHRWLTVTVERLRAGAFPEVDLEHLVEELEALAARDRRELKSNLRVLLTHLLKWQYQPAKRSGSWEATIREHRSRLQDQLNQSPSLQPYLVQEIPQDYQKARKLASAETGLALKQFPAQLPYSVATLLDEEFLPG